MGVSFCKAAHIHLPPILLALQTTIIINVKSKRRRIKGKGGGRMEGQFSMIKGAQFSINFDNTIFTSNVFEDISG